MADEKEVPMEVTEPTGSTSSRPAPAAMVVRTSIPRPSTFTGRGMSPSGLNGSSCMRNGHVFPQGSGPKNYFYCWRTSHFAW